MQSQQLLMKSQVFEDEVLAGAESADHPPEEMPERQDHSKNIIGKVGVNHGAKSFILWVCDVLARYNHFLGSFRVDHPGVDRFDQHKRVSRYLSGETSQNRTSG